MQSLKALAGVVLALLVLPTPQVTPVSQNVVIITLDGYRWQEMFSGAAQEYFKRDSKGQPQAAEKRFWRPDAGERRKLLTPFLWSVVASEGQIFGDPSTNSRAHLTNGLWFSYPGYNEMFAGAPDARIDSNQKIPNPNVTVLEWLNKRPGFAGRVAAFGSWDVLPSILNVERSGIPVGTGWQPVPRPETDRDRAVNQLAADMPLMGPAVPKLGVRKDVRVSTSQIAATIATLVGEDFRAASPQAAPPLSTGK